MLIIDDYVNGIMYVAEDMVNMRNGVPCDIRMILDDITFTRKGKVYIRDTVNYPLDLVCLKMKGKKVIEYMRERNASNFIKGV